ncbi:outer membrane protein assembly factor BamD [Nitrospirota bacterium]
MLMRVGDGLAPALTGRVPVGTLTHPLLKRFNRYMRTFTALCLAVLLVASCAKKQNVETLPIEEEFARANRNIEKKLYDDARKSFEMIIRRDTEYVYAPLALLRLADSYALDDEPRIAIEKYEEFLYTYPRHKYASYAQYQIGLVYFNLIKNPDRGYGEALDSRKVFLTLNEQYPRNPYRQDVILKLEQLKDILAKHELIIGTFYFRNKAYASAIKRLEDMRRDFPTYGNNPDALYALALSHSNLGQKESSAQYVSLLETHYPDSSQLRKAKRNITKIEKKLLKKALKQQARAKK